MNIRTSHDCPPIPTRAFDWSAVDADTYDGAPDARCPIGRGATEADAVADLLEQTEEEGDPDPMIAIERAEIERARASAAKQHAVDREMEAAFGPIDPEYVPF